MKTMTQQESLINMLTTSAVEAFTTRFGRPPTLAAAAPGRVNLIGEHTDYNDGYALPAAIDQWAVVVGDFVPDESQSRGTWCSFDLDEEFEVDYAQQLQAVRKPKWVNYPLGVVEEFRQHQIELPVMDFVLTSSIPIGAGLSSSAALTVSLATMFAQSVDLDLDPLKKAKWCMRAEHEFPKVPCGLMDPLIISLAVDDHALLLDCSTNEAKLVSMPHEDEAVFLIANTNVKRRLEECDYTQRRQECVEALHEIQTDFRAEVESLRDVTTADLKPLRDVMEPMLFKRVMHVVSENIRTLESVDALLAGDLRRFGQYLFASHLSLRDDYEVSCAELDNLVELAGEYSEVVSGRDGGVYGARMTGGGFGGCVIVLCRPESVEAVTEHLITGHLAKFDRSPTVFATRAVAGAHTLDI